MARFFKYKSLDDLRSDIEQRGLDVPLSADFSPLAGPISIGPLRAGNRLVIHPMEGCDGTLDGRPDELTYRRYERFGAGGAKLIWGEATAVVEEGRANPRQLWLHEGTAASFAQMLEERRFLGCNAGQIAKAFQVGFGDRGDHRNIRTSHLPKRCHFARCVAADLNDQINVTGVG